MSDQMSRRAAVAGLVIGSGLMGTTAMAQARKAHPRLRLAVANMREAKAYLEAAPRTFGGHKAKAIKALNVAIAELILAADFDQ